MSIRINGNRIGATKIVNFEGISGTNLSNGKLTVDGSAITEYDIRDYVKNLKVKDGNNIHIAGALDGSIYIDTDDSNEIVISEGARASIVNYGGIVDVKNLTPDNIRYNTNILGIVGYLEPGEAHAEMRALADGTYNLVITGDVVIDS